MPGLGPCDGIVELVLQIRNPLILTQEENHKTNLICCDADHVHEHLLCDNGVVPVHWGALEELIRGRLRGQRNRGGRVHDEVQPQQVQDRQGALDVDDGADHVQRQDRDVDSQLELQEFLDGVEHVAAPLGRNDNAGKVVIEQNDVRSILGDLRACDSHREAHVRILQSGSVVGSIASHRYDLPVREDFDLLLHFQHAALLLVFEHRAGIQALSQRQLVIGRRARQHPQVGPNLIELRLIERGLAFGVVVVHHFPEDLALHGALREHLAVLVAMQLHVQNASALRDGNGRCEVVASDHADVNAGLVAASNSRGHLGPERVLDAHDAQESQASLHRKSGAPIRVLDQGIHLIGIDGVHIFVRQADGAHRKFCELADDLVGEVVDFVVVHLDLLPCLEHVDDTRQDNLAGAFRIHPVAAFWLRNRPGHHLPRRCKHLRHALVSGVGRPAHNQLPDVGILVTELFRHLQESALCGVA
mmetsp:Transcript_96915/g.313229  ORF Transcript_96915/g.313229 Transcript_96915/m.313229 type:complete len:474 (-) Transcript_96915:768-2189(-)